MDGSARPRDGALSPTSLASRETSTTYYTAQNSDRMTLLSFTTSSAYYSMEDPAALRVTTEPELRAAFRELDITDKVTISSTTPLGIGGNADVMQGELVVEQTRTMRVSQRVAIKLSRMASPEPHILRKLGREIAIWRTLSHPNILALTGLYWGAARLPGMVSPWCKNGNLCSYLAARVMDDKDKLPLKCQLLEDALQGVVYLHGIAVVHGDLKGANILVTDNGRACIADFGVSGVLVEYPVASATTLGTYRWMAPELLTEHGAHTSQSDVWAFGCVLLEILSGEKPFHTLAEEHRVIIALSKAQAPPRPPALPDAHWQLSAICFAVNADERPSAADLLRLLRFSFQPPPTQLRQVASIDLPDLDSIHNISDSEGLSGPGPQEVDEEGDRVLEQKWVALISTTQRKNKKVRKLLLQGVPTSVRSRVWEFLIDSKSHRQPGVFAQVDCKGMQHWQLTDEIDADVQKLFHDQPHLSEPKGEGVIVKILLAYFVRTNYVRYHADLAIVAGHLALRYPEEDAFWMLVQLMNSHLRGYYAPSPFMLDIDTELFATTLDVADVKLSKSLTAGGIEMLCRFWFRPLFINTLPRHILHRVWDIFLFEGPVFLFRVGLATLSILRSEIFSMWGDAPLSGTPYAIIGMLMSPRPQAFPPDPETFIQLCCTMRLKDERLRKEHAKAQRLPTGLRVFVTMEKTEGWPGDNLQP